LDVGSSFTEIALNFTNDWKQNVWWNNLKAGSLWPEGVVFDNNLTQNVDFGSYLFFNFFSMVSTFLNISDIL